MSVLSELPKRLKAGIRKYEVPGASIAVLRGGRVTGSAAAGVINLDTRVPATVDTVFQIGSITKPMTTTLVMSLVDEGLIELDAPVQRYLPDFRVADLLVSREVTVRDCLTHRSGIDGDFFVDAGRGEDAPAKLLKMGTVLPSLFPIGAKHSYCNFGFVVLGEIIARVTGMSWDDAMRTRLFEPLGMSHALTLPGDTLRFRSAVGHVPSTRKKGTWYVTRQPYLSLGQGAAGATPAMSVTDLLLFARMHMDGGRNAKGDKVLSARSVKAMQTRQIALQKHARNGITHWGLGWFLMDWHGKRLYGHDGATLGQFSFLRIVPEKNLAVAMLTNGGDAQGLYQEMFGTLMPALARVSEPQIPDPDPSLRLDLSRYEGSYANINGTYTFAQKGGELRGNFRPNGAEQDAPPLNAKLAFVDRQTAVLRTGDPVVDRTVFLFSDLADDRYRYVCMGSRQYRRTG